ncbi:hypothetical protein [Chryseobacterium sp.]|uniref:hypothetical protein n=1 Tax=Chryseobacterium sp. TaxID=1871047 RepID=UPI00289D1A6D|nr:hypothetical protein [Chryseobacterium sp.]
MERFVLLHSSVDDLVHKVRKDVHELAYRGVQRERIKISIPEFYQNFLIGRIRHYNFFSSCPDLDSYFGCEVVSGYNNQICVFDKLAVPGDKLLLPIEIKSDNE